MNIDQIELFSSLSNEIRLRCLYLLASNGEVCVCEVVEALQISQPAASKALGNLKQSGLVTDRRDANWIYYSLNKDLPDWVNTVIQASVGELESNKLCSADDKRFKRLAIRPREVACP